MMDLNRRVSELAFDLEVKREPRPALVPGAAEHCSWLARTLDPFDAREIEAAGDNPRHKIEQLFVLSTMSFTVALEGRPLCMFGVWVPIRARHLAEAGKQTPWAELWLLMSSDFGRAPFSSLKLIRHAVRELLKHFDYLESHIDARHQRMVHMADWIGGDIEEPAPWGDKQQPFRRFVVRRS